MGRRAGGWWPVAARRRRVGMGLTGRLSPSVVSNLSLFFSSSRFPFPPLWRPCWLTAAAGGAVEEEEEEGEDGGRSQRCRQERGDLEDQEAHQEPRGGARVRETVAVPVRGLVLA